MSPGLAPSMSTAARYDARDLRANELLATNRPRRTPPQGALADRSDVLPPQGLPARHRPLWQARGQLPNGCGAGRGHRLLDVNAWASVEALAAIKLRQDLSQSLCARFRALRRVKPIV